MEQDPGLEERSIEAQPAAGRQALAAAARSTGAYARQPPGPGSGPARPRSCCGAGREIFAGAGSPPPGPSLAWPPPRPPPPWRRPVRRRAWGRQRTRWLHSRWRLCVAKDRPSADASRRLAYCDTKNSAKNARGGGGRRFGMTRPSTFKRSKFRPGTPPLGTSDFAVSLLVCIVHSILNVNPIGRGAKSEAPLATDVEFQSNPFHSGVQPQLEQMRASTTMGTAVMKDSIPSIIAFSTTAFTSSARSVGASTNTSS